MLLQRSPLVQRKQQLALMSSNAVNGGAYETQLTSNTYVWVESTANEPSDALYIAGNNVRDLGNGVYEVIKAPFGFLTVNVIVPVFTPTEGIFNVVL